MYTIYVYVYELQTVGENEIHIHEFHYELFGVDEREMNPCQLGGSPWIVLCNYTRCTACNSS